MAACDLRRDVATENSVRREIPEGESKEPHLPRRAKIIRTGIDLSLRFERFRAGY